MSTSATAISDSFVQLGVKSGDVVYLRADLRKVGIKPSEMKSSFVGALMEIVGQDGGLIAPSFVAQYPRWQRDIPVSDANTPSNTGALSKILLSTEGAFRSSHPTHPFVGLGRNARDILHSHTAQTSAFEPMRKLVERNDPMLLIGCVADSPGFSTVHLAQYNLGLSQQHYLKWLYHVRMPDVRGERRYYVSAESPGCSLGFGRFYSDYIKHGVLISGHVGKANAASVRAGDAYQIEETVLRHDPRYVLCDNPSCASCRLTRGYNKRALPSAISSASVKVLKRKLGALRA